MRQLKTHFLRDSVHLETCSLRRATNLDVAMPRLNLGMVADADQAAAEIPLRNVAHG